MRMPVKIGAMAVSAVALMAMAALVDARPAQAQFGGITINPGMFRGFGVGGGYRSGRRGYRNSHRDNRGGGGRHSRRASHAEKDEGGTSDNAANPSREDRALAALAPSTQAQVAVLKNVTASGVLGVVGSTNDLSEVGQTTSSERDRDYTLRTKLILERFKSEQKKSNTPGDVTEHAIERSLDRAFKEAKLETFESFLGENWSSERLRVLILDRVETEMPRLFEGNNRGVAPMEELDRIIQRSAESVYRRIFEISELLAANRSTALFLQRLYQTHGGLVDDQLREVTDRMITKAASTAIAKFDGQVRRDENSFALRYRAQRIVLDCLSENVEKITSSETGIATIGEIEQKIGQTSATQCAGWVEAQFGSETDKIKAQKPMPLRVIWAAEGPKDDPSMYGRASGTF